MVNDFNIDRINRITNLKFCDEKDRSKMILVYLGLKPACSIMLYEEDGHTRAKEILSEVGLHCEQIGKFNKEWHETFQAQCEDRLILPINELCVSKDKEKAIELSRVSSSKDHQRYGELMGYPQSAIDNFIKKEPQLDFDDHKKLKKEHGVIFCFRVPKENYQKELELLKAWSMAIKKYAPALYNEMLKWP